MNTQHTQGEWNIEENTDHTPFVMGDDNNLIAVFVEREDSLFYGRTIEETRANAKLITAAPDLLTALQNMVEEFEIFADIPKGYKDLAGWDGGENPKGLAIKSAILAIQKATNNQ